MRLCIIGCGNVERGDDAAGVLATRRLRELGVEAEEQDGEALGLLERWTGAAGVILIDAVVTGAPVGQIAVWDARTAALAAGPFRCSTHALGVAEAIALARVLDRLPPRFLIYGIEGRRFDPGAEPSPEVVAAAEVVARRIVQEVAGP